MRVLLLHGRAQSKVHPSELKLKWINHLRHSFEMSSIEILDDIKFDMPYYGRQLDEVISNFSAYKFGARGDEKIINIGFNEFFLTGLKELGLELYFDEIIDTSIEEIKGDMALGVMQKFLGKVDDALPVVARCAIYFLLRDVYYYLFHTGTKIVVDNIVRRSLTEEPTIIVAHSLGSVVGYSVLSAGSKKYNVEKFITLGSPMGMNLIKDEFFPMKYPDCVLEWHNIINKGDLVAIKEIDANDYSDVKILKNYKIDCRDSDSHSVEKYLSSDIMPMLLLQ